MKYQSKPTDLASQKLQLVVRVLVTDLAHSCRYCAEFLLAFQRPIILVNRYFGRRPLPLFQLHICTLGIATKIELCINVLSNMNVDFFFPPFFQTEFGHFENSRFVYRIHRSPMCEYMINFVHKLKQLPEKYMMNSVLENFTILQVS